MDPDRFKGTVRDAKGQAEDGFGRVTDTARQRARSFAGQATDTAERLIGSAADAARSVASDYDLDDYARAGQRLARRATQRQPLEALLVAGALGYFIGWLVHSHH